MMTLSMALCFSDYLLPIFVVLKLWIIQCLPGFYLWISLPCLCLYAWCLTLCRVAQACSHENLVPVLRQTLPFKPSWFQGLEVSAILAPSIVIIKTTCRVVPDSREEWTDVQRKEDQIISKKCKNSSIHFGKQPNMWRSTFTFESKRTVKFF